MKMKEGENMNYWDIIFIGIYLPLTVIIYNFIKQKNRWKVLLISSYIFFWSISGKLLIYLLMTTLLMHYFGLWITEIRNEMDDTLANSDKSLKKEIKNKYKARERKILIFTILIIVGMLIILKYSEFLGKNINTVLEFICFPIQINIQKYMIPIGISFYTMQAISYICDIYLGKIKADRNIRRLALFISFFPQIMEGPICRYSQTADKLWEGRDITYENLTFGIQRILYGILKKTIIADRLNPLILNVFDNYAKYDGGIITASAALYTLQLYMDFSGTMDIVIGIAEIFGVDLPENFRQPFFSKTISEFWTRWHITLGTWFKDYIYYPVLMSKRCKKLMKPSKKILGNYFGTLFVSSIALFCVWFLNGVWHGSGWNYIFFGMYHFVLIITGRLIEPAVKSVNKKLHINSNNFIYFGLQIIRTTCLVFIGEMFFRANGLKSGISMFVKLITQFKFNSLINGNMLSLGLDKKDFMVIFAVTIIIFVIGILRERGIRIRHSISKRNIVIRWLVYYVLILMIIILGAYGLGYKPVDPMYAQF